MFDMLNFALKYCEVVDKMMMRPVYKLHSYELSGEAWMGLRQLQQVLKVREALKL